MAVADGALAYDLTTASFGIDLVHADGTWLELIAPSSPHLVSAFAVDRANAQQIVWVESDSLGVIDGNSVIWTAPYATTTTGIARRRVALLNDALGRGGDRMVVNAGVALNLIDKDKALLTRLFDGMGWLVTAESGDAFTQPLWADDNEVWISTGMAADNSWQAEQTGILRIARSSLGAPTVLSGL
jgi:hypothetical protein